jgi:hypothetical protein
MIRHLAVALLLSSTAQAAPPAPLQCVERYLGARAEQKDGAWFAVTTDGNHVPYERGERSFAERIDDPGVKDLFSIRYEKGAVKPVTDEDHDPGRIRAEALYRAAYPEKALVKATFMGHAVEVNDKVAPALARVEARLAKLADPSLQPFFAKLGGSHNDRAIAGTTRQSAHAWGIALDLNPSLSHYWRWQKKGWENKIPQAIVDAFEAEGFIWGGRWYHFDTMHFEYRPELLDPRCYP